MSARRGQDVECVAIGGFLYARNVLHAAGYVAAAFVALAVMAVVVTKPRKVRA